MSNISTITKKGQITIPAEYRKDYNFQPGKKVIFVPTPDGLVIKPVQHQLPTLRGIIKTNTDIQKIKDAVKDIRQDWRLESGE